MTRLYNSYSLHFFLLSIKKGPADATIKNLKSVCYIFMFGNLFQKARDVCIHLKQFLLLLLLMRNGYYVKACAKLLPQNGR